MGKGSEVTTNLDINQGQHPEWCSGFWCLRLGGSETHSRPRLEGKSCWFRGKHNMLRFEADGFEVSGEISGGRWDAGLRARREAQVMKMWESSVQTQPTKMWVCVKAGSRKCCVGEEEEAVPVIETQTQQGRAERPQCPAAKARSVSERGSGWQGQALSTDHVACGVQSVH